MQSKGKAPRGNAGPRQHIRHDLLPPIEDVPLDRQQWRDAFLTHQLDLFGARCAELVKRVNFGTTGFIDAVDLAWSAAVWSGVVDSAGPDRVQEIMRAHFMGARR